MATATTELTDDMVAQIGATSGLVWETLATEGAMSLAKLTRSVDAHRDLVMQAVGWLAREDKLTFQEGARGKLVSLAR